MANCKACQLRWCRSGGSRAPAAELSATAKESVDIVVGLESPDVAETILVSELNIILLVRNSESLQRILAHDAARR